LGALRQDLDVAAHLRRSFARHPALWIGGTVLLGLCLSRLFGGKKKTVTSRKGPEPELEKVGKAGLVLGALKIAFDVARPVLIPWATRRFTEYFGAEKDREYPPR
jgi:hypothetical protein